MECCLERGLHNMLYYEFYLPLNITLYRLFKWYQLIKLLLIVLAIAITVVSCYTMYVSW